MTAARPGPRSVSISSIRSSACTNPTAYITSARLSDSMCGTLKLSRVTTRFGRPGNVWVRCTARFPRPNTFCLKKFGRSAAVTFARFGVRPSYSGTWSEEFGVNRNVPPWPGGRTLNASPAFEWSVAVCANAVDP